ncbi:MAG: nucleoside phosphorylase [Oscillospiraceae bacterium]|jgi:uridine phosphorylase
MVYRAEKLTRPDGKMWHIGLDEKDIGKHVILPADPARCEMVAKQFEGAELKAVSRGNPAYTGTYKGIPVTVMCTGMGGTAVAICTEELKQIGAKTLIRMGTAGSLQRYIPAGSFVIATGAVRGDGTTREYIPDTYPAVADPDLVIALRQAAREYGVEPYVGVIRSHDAFYMESPGAHEGWEERIKPWTDANVLAVENESSSLFVVSSLLRGIRAGTILLTGGNLYESHGSMSTSNSSDYAEKVDLMTKITLRAIEIVDALGDLPESR